MPFEIESKNLSFQIAKKDMSDILLAESSPLAINTSLVTKLNQVDGLTKVEYDGHFGPYIFFCLAHPEPRGVRAQITKIIRDHIQECREWVATPAEELQKRTFV